MTDVFGPPAVRVAVASVMGIAPLGLADVNVDDLVFNPANGHYYMAVEAPGGITWDDARVGAAAMEFMGLSGHLATLTSAEENQFIVDELTEAAIDLYWIGGFQPEGSSEPGAGWQWVTGEAWSFTNWAEFEPNNGDGADPERHMSLWRADWGDPVPAPDTVLGVWNDLPDWYAAPGYVVEFSIPTPGGSGVALAAAALAARRRRR